MTMTTLTPRTRLRESLGERFDGSKVAERVSTRSRRRRSLPCRIEGKKFACETPGCGRSFTRAEHLQRHLLNHSTGEYTCDRCRAHFKRRDLLARHLTRHAQKDSEAGAEGRGILNTRKRLWRDTAGNIVTQKPSATKPTRRPQPPSRPLYQNLMHTFDSNSAPLLPHHSEGYVPITPPESCTGSISSSSSSVSSLLNTPDLLPGLLSPNSGPMQLPSPATEHWAWPTSPYAELDLDLPTLVPGQAKPLSTTNYHSSRGEQWTHPTSPVVELDLFDTSVAKNTPFADLFDPSVEVFKSYSFTSLRDCWGLFDTLRRQVR